MDNKNVEQWKPIKGFEGLYEVSDMGRVKSVERTCKGKCGSVRRIKEKMLKLLNNGNDYLHVNLSKNGVEKVYGVHVLVALAFPEICGEPFEGAEVNHIDENHFNNTPENLNWLSHPDNINHGTRNERTAKTHTNSSRNGYRHTRCSVRRVGVFKVFHAVVSDKEKPTKALCGLIHFCRKYLQKKSE